MPRGSRKTSQKVPLTDGPSRSGPLDEQWRPRGPVHWERKPFPGWEEGSALATDIPMGQPGNRNMLRIERGGILRAGALEYSLREGDIYDAPYTRFCFRWRERAQQQVSAVLRETGAAPKDVMSKMLFEHLVGLQATQRRALGIIMRNQALIQENTHLREELYGLTETGGMIG